MIDLNAKLRQLVDDIDKTNQHYIQRYGLGLPTRLLLNASLIKEHLDAAPVAKTLMEADVVEPISAPDLPEGVQMYRFKD